jgi:hypothetical protein
MNSTASMKSPEGGGQGRTDAILLVTLACGKRPLLDPMTPVPPTFD